MPASAARPAQPTVLHIALFGPGLVGSALLAQLHAAAPALLSAHNLSLRVHAVLRSRTMLLSTSPATPLDLSRFSSASPPPRLPLPADPARALNTILSCAAVATVNNGAPFHRPVLIDCTASAAVPNLYGGALAAGASVVAANKRACAGPRALYDALRRAAASASAPSFLYEANVCAGLPVMSVVRDALRTGDVVRCVEGVLSGTLGFLLSEVGEGVGFAAAVREARDRGFTEPDPREDLGGLDVARKVVILGREVGLEVEVEDVPVRSLVPAGLENVAVEEFMERLGEFDAGVREMAEREREKGCVLRYVGVVDAEAKRCAVELKGYPVDHPFARLRGPDNMVCITTKRYCAQPMIVQGPGAGADVTAAGVFSDLLRVAGCV